MAKKTKMDLNELVHRANWIIENLLEVDNHVRNAVKGDFDRIIELNEGIEYTLGLPAFDFEAFAIELLITDIIFMKRRTGLPNINELIEIVGGLIELIKEGELQGILDRMDIQLSLIKDDKFSKPMEFPIGTHSRNKKLIVNQKTVIRSFAKQIREQMNSNKGLADKINKLTIIFKKNKNSLLSEIFNAIKEITLNLDPIWDYIKKTLSDYREYCLNDPAHIEIMKGYYNLELINISIDFSEDTFKFKNTVEPHAEAFLNLFQKIPHVKIRECLTPDCNRWFVHKKGRQQYCTKACNGRFRTKKYIKKNPEKHKINSSKYNKKSYRKKVLEGVK